MGILFKSYLDELSKMDEPTSEATRAEVKDKAQSWLKHGDFRGSFDDSLRLWDAVSLRVVMVVRLHADS